jgi:hypothetical protein
MRPSVWCVVFLHTYSDLSYLNRLYITQRRGCFTKSFVGANLISRRWQPTQWHNFHSTPLLRSPIPAVLQFLNNTHRLLVWGFGNIFRQLVALIGRWFFRRRASTGTGPHTQTSIRASTGVLTHDPSIEASNTHVLDRRPRVFTALQTWNMTFRSNGYQQQEWKTRHSQDANNTKVPRVSHDVRTCSQTVIVPDARVSSYLLSGILRPGWTFCHRPASPSRSRNKTIYLLFKLNETQNN